MSPNYAYVTLLTQASYLAGVLVLDQSLRSVGSKYSLVVMVTPSLPDDVRAVLRKRRIRTREVDSLRPPDRNHTLAEHDVRFADTWTKLRCISHLFSQCRKKLTFSLEDLNLWNTK